MFDGGQVRAWLTMLHARAPGLTHVCGTGNWTGATFAASDLEAAVDYVRSMEGREGVYARVTTLRHPLAAGRRGGVEDTCALPALWADIDIAGPGHAEPNLPPDTAAALRILDVCGLPTPSVIVHSGGGIYPIWHLDPPHPVNGDLPDLVDLSANWQKVIAAGAASLGWHYGAGVGDLARVLRIPGTVNRKAGLERPCRIIGGTGVRYPLARLYGSVADALAVLAPPPPQPPPAPPRPAQPATGTTHEGTSPGDAFAAATDWEDILVPAGWRLAYARGPVRYWRRPGKERGGISATTNALGTDRLHVFTTATSFEATSYSKLGAFAHLEHGGDLHAAAKALRSAGYGTDPARVEAEAVATILGSGAAVPQVPGAGVALPAAPGDDAQDAALDAEAMARQRHREEVAAEARRLRVRRDAAREVDAEDLAATWREPPSTATLTDELALPDEPVLFRIERLLPAGGNVLLTAQFKAGKSTLCNNLIRSLADGLPFLGRFEVEALPAGERVALFNYEISAAQNRRWLRDLAINNTDRVCVLNVRGYRLPPTVAQVEAWIVEWLRAHRATVWIVDPFARAFLGGGEENSNSEVGAFLDTLDVIKERAGVRELILPAHTGRAEQEQGQERARGATRLDDWADARWLLTVDDQRRRFFRASGRDVDVDEEMLTFEADTRRLTMGGWDRPGMKRQDFVAEMVAYVAGHPGSGVNEVLAGVGGKRERVVAALHDAIKRRLITVVEGANRKREHYPVGTLPSGGEE